MRSGAVVAGPDRAVMAAAVAEQYCLGKTVGKLAEETGRSTFWIENLLDAAGVPRRPRRAAGEKRRTRGKYLTGVAQAEAARLLGAQYQSGGVSLRALAEANGMSYGKAHRLVKLSGVVMRPKGSPSSFPVPGPRRQQA
jgi:hypothetical protein